MEKVKEAEKWEVEMSLLAHRLVDFDNHYSEILGRYNVKDPEEIKKKIELKEIEAHPAYEDYLDAISYKIRKQEILMALQKHLDEARSTS